MKKITKILSILMMAAFTLSCSNLFNDYEKYPDPTKDPKDYVCSNCETHYATEAEKNDCAKQPGCPKYVGPVSEIGDYATSLTASRFDKVKDVQRSPNGSTSYSISSPSNCFNAKKGSRTTDSDWANGSYVKFSKVSTKTQNNKTIPVYKVTLYKGGSSSNTVILADDATIVGIGKYGILYFTDGSHYGNFIYTNAGWKASSSGTTSLTVNFNVAYPTEEEIDSAIKSFNK